MKYTLSTAVVAALQVNSSTGAGPGTTYDGNTYGDGTIATGGSHDNVRVDYYDRGAIKIAVEDLIYGKYVDSKTQKRNSGKTFRISRFLHILDDANVNNQGLDGDGNVIGNTSVIFNNIAYANQGAADAAKATYDATAEGIAAIANNVEPLTFAVTTGGGNMYGSSRNVGDVVTGIPVLSEGADRVNRVGVTRENFSCTLVRQGNFEEYNDEVQLFSDHDMQMEYRTKLARLAIEVKDDNTQLGMLGAAGVRFYAGSATSIATVGASDEVALPTYDFFRKIVKRLKINLAVRNDSMLTGSTKVGTTPINRAYYAIVGPDVVYDVEGITEFRAVHEYGYASNLADNEIGSIHETRFLETTRAMKYSGQGAAVGTNPGAQETNGAYDVFPILYPTKGSYATVSLAGAGAIKFKSKAPGKATSEDPYGVKGLFSYNTWFAGLALQPEKLLVAYCTASE
ncbi:N4-gp56 family major capsid protein [Methanosarcinales archaeon]|nr:MAG: N4-gp56 family major capsid protein [Methanosarcinales archaeon]